MSQPTPNKRKIGKLSENIALRYLTTKGYELVKRNYQIKGGEIDLIMKHNDCYVFVEVKSLRKHSDYLIYETLTKKKMKFLRRSINVWLLSANLTDAFWRVDFICISFKGASTYLLEHFKYIEI